MATATLLNIILNWTSNRTFKKYETKEIFWWEEGTPWGEEYERREEPSGSPTAPWKKRQKLAREQSPLQQNNVKYLKGF